MKLSVLLTSYNCREYIDDAINSVTIQDLPFDWELLIGDDGSDDGTVERINQWIQNYPNNIRLYVMDRTSDSAKSGTRAAHNRANLLDNCSGEYIAFLDGDDQLLGTEKFKKQIELLDDDHYADCSCSAHNIVANYVMKSRQEPMADVNLKFGVIQPAYYWDKLYFHTNTIVFRASCKKMLLDERYRNYLNDNFITYILIQHGSILYLPELYAQYNITGNGLWTGKKRTYGCFRNVILYDLEVQINKEMKKESYRRHMYDFLYLAKYYTAQDEDVQRLIDGLSAEDFPTTNLLASVDGQAAAQKRARDQFCKEAHLRNTIKKATLIPGYLKKHILKR